MRPALAALAVYALLAGAPALLSDADLALLIGWLAELWSEGL